MFANFTKIAKTATLALVTVALAAGTLKPLHADSIGGPWRASNRVLSAGNSHRFAVSFYGGETALAEARGDGDVDLYVYDEDGDLVTYDRASDSHPVCVWTPPYTQRYTIKVVNADGKTIVYTMETN